MGNVCSLMTADDGHLVPGLQKGERMVRFGSLYDGAYAAERWIIRHVPEGTEYAVVTGMGDGQILSEMAEQIPGFIMVYEPEEAIYHAMINTPIFQKLRKMSRIMITYGADGMKELGELVQELLNEDCLDTVILRSLPVYVREYPDSCHKVKELYDQYRCDVEFMKAGIQRFVDSMIHNQLRNIPCMKDGVILPRLRKQWDSQIPVILVSAGPSLEKNIEELKKASGKAFIFCADAALPLMLEHEIIPDLVGCTDADKNMNCFENPKSLEIPLLVTTVSPVSLLQKSMAPKIWGDDLPFVREILVKSDVDIPKIPCYLGVSTTLLAVALELGAEKIILVGQDLAYSADGRSHISGREERFQKDENYLTEGYYGGMVYSRPDWTVFREWMEDAVKAFSDRTIINATEGGSRIQGTIQKPLSETIDKMTSTDIRFQNLIGQSGVRMTINEFKRVMREFRKAGDDLKKICEDGYEKTFFESNYMSMPVMRLVVHYMKSLDDSDRKSRFKRATEYVRSCFLEIF